MANTAVDEFMLVEYVRESERIAGNRLPADSKLWSREDGGRHLEIVKIIAAGQKPVPIYMINCTLTGRTEKWFRNGIEGGHREGMPSGEIVPGLIEKHDRRVEWGVNTLQGKSVEERTEFAWLMHHRLLCIRAFKECNWRTARIQLNQVLRLLGLPWITVRYKDSLEYEERFYEYKRTKFIPSLARLQRVA